MPNRYLNRIRLPDTGGTLTAAAAIGATTLTSTDFATQLPAMTSGADYVPLVVRNAAGEQQAIDAYFHDTGASPNDVTITPALTIALAVGDTWDVAIRTDDFPRGPDYPPPNVSGYSEEFDVEDLSGAFPAGWAWQRQGTGTFRREGGAGVIQCPSGNDYTWIDRSAPAGTWELRAKISSALRMTNYHEYGITLRDSSTGKAIFFSCGFSGAASVMLSRITAVPAWDSFFNPQVALYGVERMYVRVVKNAANSFDFWWSADGRAWSLYATAQDLSTWLTGGVSHLGFYVSGSSTSEMACDFFRVFT